MDWFSLWDRFVCLLYPPRCVICGQVVAYEDWCCPSCGVDTVNWRGQLGETAAIAPFCYEGDLKKVVYDMKASRDIRTHQFFAHHMVPLIRETWAEPFDVLVPVPSSPARMRERGHNQARLLAVHLGRELGIPVASGHLRQADRAEVQHRLTERERWENARKSFSIEPGDSVRGKRVLLVDDVITTGATMESCAALLRAAGGEFVCGAAATHTPGGVDVRVPEENADR